MRSIVIVALAACLPCAAQAAELAGRIALSVSGQDLRADAAGDAVVWFRPARTVAPSEPKQPFELWTRGKQFDPQVLVVPVGATVRFPNADPILHNVFWGGGAERVDLGFQPKGPGRSHVFAQAGLVRVYCNVHHDMAATVLVLDTPYVTRPDPDGRWRIVVPDGARGTVFVWHPRAAPWHADVDGRARTTWDVRLSITRPRVPPHRNKDGHVYDDARRGY